MPRTPVPPATRLLPVSEVGQWVAETVGLPGMAEKCSARRIDGLMLSLLTDGDLVRCPGLQPRPPAPHRFPYMLVSLIRVPDRAGRPGSAEPD